MQSIFIIRAVNQKWTGTRPGQPVSYELVADLFCRHMPLTPLTALTPLTLSKTSPEFGLNSREPGALHGYAG